MPFKVGDIVVYPPHGIARIGSIESQQVGENLLECYILQIMASGATVIVPATNAAERAGMRNLMSTEEVESVFSILRIPQKVSQRTWNRRFREFNDKLRSGSVLKAAEVYRDLCSLQGTKQLSYGEKKMLERSEELLISEICASQNLPKGEIKQQLDAAIAN
jgi:CarD family transcriptional regulator